MIESILKPCPFCGSEVTHFQLSWGVVGVVNCTGCKTKFVIPWNECETKQDLYNAGTGEQKMKKPIEEMANHLIDIEHNFNEYCSKPCRECELGGVVNCESHYKAEALYNAGYRKQKEGEWKWISDDDCICSACGKVFYTADNAYAGTRLWNYCPNCGAKMKGGAE